MLQKGYFSTQLSLYQDLIKSELFHFHFLTLLSVHVIEGSLEIRLVRFHSIRTS